MAAIQPLAPIDQQALEKKHLPVTSGFTQRAKELANRPLSKFSADLALELDGEAKRFLEAAEKERTDLKAPILEAGRKLDAFFKRLEAPAETARSTARALISRFDTEERRKADEARRKAEQEAREAAERQKQAEVAALIAQAGEAADKLEAATILQEAIEIEQTPVQPVLVPEVAPPKLEGASIRYDKVGTVSNARELLAWLLEGKRDDLINELIDWKQGGINAALRRGLTLPGVEVALKPVVSNRSRG